MTIKPKLLSTEDLERIEFIWKDSLTPKKLLAHIAALDQQIADQISVADMLRQKAEELQTEVYAQNVELAAKDAEIKRMAAGIDAFRRLQEQASRSYEHERPIIRGEVIPQIKDIPHG